MAYSRANIAIFSKGKVIPLQALDRPLGLQEVEAPRIYRQLAHKGGKVVSHKRR